MHRVVYPCRGTFSSSNLILGQEEADRTVLGGVMLLYHGKFCVQHLLDCPRSTMIFIGKPRLNVQKCGPFSVLKRPMTSKESDGVDYPVRVYIIMVVLQLLYTFSQ